MPPPRSMHVLGQPPKAVSIIYIRYSMYPSLDAVVSQRVATSPLLREGGCPRGQSVRHSTKYQNLVSHWMDTGDITNDLVAKWSHRVPADTIDALRAHLQRPLREDEKIPISQKKFDALCATYILQAPEDRVTAQQLSTLFRVSADERAERAEFQFLFAVRDIAPQTGTEPDFHSTYDINISKIVTFSLPRTTSFRDSDTSTPLKRPGYGLLLKGHCIFRGEEMGSDQVGDPQQELVAKIAHWGYQPLPYILGLLRFYYELTKLSYICDRILCRNSKRPLCCNYPDTFRNHTPV